MSDEQEAELQRFLDEKLEIRKQLREVRYELNADIERLGTKLKIINTALVPVLLTLGVLLWWLVARLRRRTA